MQIALNGDIRQVAEECNIGMLLQQLGLENQRLAVEVNQEIVPRSQFADYRLKADDRVEIVRAVGGG